MKKHKKLAAILAALMILQLVVPCENGMVVHAEESTEAGLEVEYADSLDEVVGKSLHEVSVDELSHDDEMVQKGHYELNASAIDDMMELQSSDEDGISTHASGGITQTFYGVLEQAGTFTYMLLSLAPGQIIQATLAGPNNASIDYDLLLYTYNDDGSLGTCVAESTLNTYINTYTDSNTSKSVEDAVAYINTGNTSQNYALLVFAAMGCSSTETFKLTVSLDNFENFDAGEPNDNPFSAVVIPDGAVISGCNLNVSNDQDWYVWNATSSFAYMMPSLDNSNYTVEVYQADGQSMKLVKTYPNIGLYKIYPGKYYFRVHNEKDNFVSSEYTLSVQAYGVTPARMTVVFNGDMGAGKVPYTWERYNRFESILKPMVIVEDASGYPVFDVGVTLYWKSGARPAEDGNDAWEYEKTDKDGIATFYMVTYLARGVETWEGSGFRHYFDIDDLMYICGDLSISQKVYHLWRSEPIG